MADSIRSISWFLIFIGITLLIRVLQQHIHPVSQPTDSSPGNKFLRGESIDGIDASLEHLSQSSVSRRQLLSLSTICDTDFDNVCTITNDLSTCNSY